MNTRLFKLFLLLVGIVLVGAGCNSGCVRKVNPFKEDKSTSSTSYQSSTTSPDNISPVVVERMPSSLTEEPQKFILKKNGKVVKEIIPVQGNPFTMRVFKQTDRYVYIAGYREGLGGYILFEADPIVLYQVNLENSEAVELTRNDLIVQDIFNDDLIAWVDVVNRKIIIRRINGNFELQTNVPSKYSQFGNVRFSPDGKKFAYAAALGNQDKEAGAVFVVEVNTGKQVLVAETTEAHRYFEVTGWKSSEVVDYVDRGVVEK